MKGETTMKKLAMKMLSLLLVLSLLLPTCVFAQPGQDEDGEPGTQSTTSEETTTFTEGGNGDGDADVPTGGGNGDGDTKDVNGGSVTQSTTSEKTTTFTEGEDGDEDADTPTGGGNGDETTKDENGDGDADVSEEEAAPTVVEVVLDEEEDEAYNDELFAAYVAREFGLDDGYGAALFASEHATHGLSAEARAFYDELKSKVIAVANGTATSTTFSPLTKTWTCTWNISELGADAVSGGNLTTDGEDAFEQLAQEAAGDIVNRLLADCPLELFWFNKTSYRYSRSTHLIDTTANTISTTFKGFQFPVALAYRANPAEEYTVTSDLSRVTTAKTNALNIVNNKPTTTTKAQLEYFFEQIIGLVDYDRTAAGWDNTYTQTHYGDPWQLINVFDHTTANEKKVVCEGYAKAFQYLCELAAIPGVKCYSVTGTMSGGNHMWNVVEVGNARYLVDVTNCDDNPTNSGGVSIGYPKNLFMKVTTGSGGTTYDFSFSGQTVRYVYGTDMKDLFCEGYPALRELQNIEIATPPSKTAYAQGENFDPTGMVVTATYSDGNKIPVTDYTVEGGKPFVSGNTSVTIKYAELDNEKTATQTVTVTAKKSLNNATIIITEPTYNGSTQTVGIEVKYDGVTLTNGTDYKVTGTQTLTNVSATAETIVIEGMGSYEGTVDRSWNLKKASSTCTAPKGTTGLKYNGAAQDLVSTWGGATGGTLEYSLDGSSWDTAKPTFKETNAGTYTLHYRVKGDGNHEDIAAQQLKVEIKPLEVTLTWNNTGDRTYDGNNSNVTATVSNKAIAADEVNVTVTGGTEANAGSHTATANALTGAAAGNYKLPDTKPTQAYKINAATITVDTDAFKNYTGVYDGNPHSIKVDRNKIETKGGQTFTIGYNTDGGSTYGAALPEITNVSDSPKTVYYKITAPNHKAATGTATITINKANATITAATPRELVKNGVAEDISNWATCDSGAALTYTLVGSPTGITFDAANNKLTADASTSTTTFSITVSAGNTSNYNAPTAKTITVNVVDKAAAGVSIASVPTSKTYGDENFTVTADKTAPNGGTWSWSSSDSGILEIVSGANTATPTIKVKKADSTGATLTVTYTSATHYGTSTTGAITVAQKDVTITGLGAENKVYDGSNSATVTGTADVAGKVGSDDVTVTGGTATFNNKNVGTGKTVTFTGYSLSGVDAGNYKLTAQPADVTAEITAKEVTVTGITATNRTYAKDNLEVTLTGGTLSGVLPGDTVTIDLTNAKGKMANANAGTGKAVTVTGVALGGTDKGNYRLKEQPTGVTVDIAQAATPTAPTGLNGVKGNALSTVALPDGWTWVSGTTVMNTVGSQTFKANYTDAAGNYASDTNVDVAVNVMDKTDVGGKISFNDGTLVYMGAGQKYETASISGITAGAGVTWTYGYTAGTGTLDGGLPKTVGTYTVTVTYEDSLHYGTKSVTLTITQATPTGAPKFTKITSSGKTLGDAALVKTVSGPGDGFSVAGTVESGWTAPAPRWRIPPAWRRTSPTDGNLPPPTATTRASAARWWCTPCGG